MDLVVNLKAVRTWQVPEEPLPASWPSSEAHWGPCSEVLPHAASHLVLTRGLWWRNPVGLICREATEKVTSLLVGLDAGRQAGPAQGVI